MLNNKFAVIVILGLSLGKLDAGTQIKGACPKQEIARLDSKMNGKYYQYGLYLDIKDTKLRSTTLNICELINYPLKELISSSIVGTDNKNYIVHWKCVRSTTGLSHTRATFIFTKEKQPSKTIIESINKVHRKLGLEPNKIVHLCDDRNQTERTVYQVSFDST